MTLHTNLKHIDNRADYDEALAGNENVMICCGRMGPMCIPVYQSMIELESDYPNVTFMDFAFDSPDSPQAQCPASENMAAVAAGGGCGNQAIGLCHAPFRTVT